eukprot:jgi/Picsp_1/6437/NSC_03784-R2_universal stress family protein
MKESMSGRLSSSDTVGSRRIAFCVAEWSHQTTVLTWAWLRQYFLKQEQDEIYIVHTGKKEKWDQSGPLCADLTTCLKDWKHQVSNIGKFLEQHDIDLVILGEDFPRQGGFRVSSVSDWVKSHISRPFIIVRKTAVVNDRLRISAREPLSPTRRAPSLSPASAPRRKVAIAYHAMDLGYHMVEMAKRLVLLPSDEIFLVSCHGSERKATVVKQTKSLLKTISMGIPIPGTGTGDKEGDDADYLSMAAQSLSQFDAHMDVILHGDPRNVLPNFCEEENIDILVISSRSAGKIRKTLSGGSVSGYLMEKVSCPCLVLPLKCLGFTETEEMHRSLTLLLEEDGSGGEEVSIEVLKQQLAEKDELIQSLREEIEHLKCK